MQIYTDHMMYVDKFTDDSNKFTDKSLFLPMGFTKVEGVARYVFARKVNCRNYANVVSKVILPLKRGKYWINQEQLCVCPKTETPFFGLTCSMLV